MQQSGLVMTRPGFEVGGLSVGVSGAGTYRNREPFAPPPAATLELSAAFAEEPLRPVGQPLVESDTWAVFERGEGRSFVSQVQLWSPPEVARIDLDPDGSTGRLWLRPGLAVDPLDYPLDQLLMIHLLHRHGGLLLHAACAIVDGQAVLVAGPSGQGKTTFARAAAGIDGALVVTDERVVVRRREGRWWAFGTPWAGEGKFMANDGAPLARIFVLDKSDVDEVSALTPVRALAGLMRAHFPAGWLGDAMTDVSCIEELVTEVPCFRLRTRLRGFSHRLALEARS